VCTRVPLMIRVPRGVPGLPQGATEGQCEKPVNLVSLFPTLLELCELPMEPHHDGPSLVPLLEDPNREWPHASITYLGDPGSYGLSTEDWRLIHYVNGDEELYHTANDPYEWTNLAPKPESAPKIKELRLLAPEQFATKPPPSIDALPALKWNPSSGKPTPASQPDGNPFDVVFLNSTANTVKLYWMNREGRPKFYADISSGKNYRQQTRPGAVWLIRDSSEKDIGHFRVDDRTSKAIIPNRKLDK
ncbi:MAG: hypothetical protein KDA84_28230, partial [Planctomycetaceae bacterium]|nr:hypothetical protein [Planctomycetaceae bacterium]